MRYPYRQRISHCVAGVERNSLEVNDYDLQKNLVIERDVVCCFHEILSLLPVNAYTTICHSVPSSRTLGREQGNTVSRAGGI
jgi:hypothetical protein